MSVTGKTLGIVLIGLVGLLVYLAVYIGSVFGIGAVAAGATYVGLILTAVLFVVITILTSGRSDA